MSRKNFHKGANAVMETEEDVKPTIIEQMKPHVDAIEDAKRSTRDEVKALPPKYVLGVDPYDKPVILDQNNAVVPLPIDVAMTADEVNAFLVKADTRAVEIQAARQGLGRIEVSDPSLPIDVISPDGTVANNNPASIESGVDDEPVERTVLDNVKLEGVYFVGPASVDEIMALGFQVQQSEPEFLTVFVGGEEVLLALGEGITAGGEKLESL